MLYFIHGTDKDKARQKANDLVAALQKKKPDASFFKLTSENWSEGSFEEYIGGQGLFENKYIVLVDGLFGDKVTKEFISKRLKEIKESQNVFIFREGEVDKATLTKIEKNAEKVQEFGTGEAKGKKQEFNTFSLTDALGRRDKKQLWVLYHMAKQANVEDEQIHGVLFWQVKNMMLAQKTQNAAEAGLNPFVFSKAQGFARNFRDGELAKMSGELVSLSHEARRGAHDFDVALERWILNV